jgi:RimJ/RimL family protein N-acetyltransferase
VPPRVVADRVTTERLALRRPQLDDLPFVFEVHGDAHANRFNRAGPHRTLDDSRAVLEAWLAHWNTHGFGPWLVEERSRPIGFAGLRWRGTHEMPGLNLYFRLQHSSWGRGYATEAARASIRFGLDELRAAEVTALINPGNQPSIRVAERAGMTLAATVDYRGAPSLLYVMRAIA